MLHSFKKEVTINADIPNPTAYKQLLIPKYIASIMTFPPNKKSDHLDHVTIKLVAGGGFAPPLSGEEPKKLLLALSCLILGKRKTTACVVLIKHIKR